MLPPWKPERSVRVRTEPRPGLLFRIENQDPVQPAIADDRFLSVLVGVHLLQEKRKDHIVGDKAAVPGTVAGAHPRDANQPRDLLGLHRAHERARRGREQRHLAERAYRCTQRADYGLTAFECFAQGCFIAGISDDELRPRDVLPAERTSTVTS